MHSPKSISSLIRSVSEELSLLGVKNLWLFGSAARGEIDAKDLDFLVDFDAPPTLTGFMNLKFFLEEKLQMPVDLHSRNSCPDRFMQRIQPDLLHVA
jgi:predicted nucleotidyltransferase